MLPAEASAPDAVRDVFGRELCIAEGATRQVDLITYERRDGDRLIETTDPTDVVARAGGWEVRAVRPAAPRLIAAAARTVDQEYDP